jgi:hypothetical protein
MEHTSASLRQLGVDISVAAIAVMSSLVSSVVIFEVANEATNFFHLSESAHSGG